jgi:4-hydroxy-tetrahydrodipicolinate reductase
MPHPTDIIVENPHQSPVRVALLGYGKMGKIVGQLAPQQGFEVVWHSPSGEWNAGEFRFPPDMPAVDVAIEFSSPQGAPGHIRACLERGIPVVVGTTGWYAHLEELTHLCRLRGGALLCATNFSVGVHLFWELAERVTQVMRGWPGYRISIEETHHTEKKDAPSGTAITLAQRVVRQLVTGDGKPGPDGMGPPGPAEPPIVSHRRDGVVGSHRLVFTSGADAISLQHDANSRDAFALGALRAARWILGKQGVFEFGDVLRP